LRDLNQLDAALASYDRAIAVKRDYADAYYNRSLLLLLKGDFARGWAEYEWRWRSKSLPTFKGRRDFGQPLWLGKEPIAGKTILLHGEQGLGDTLQFCRYVKLVADLGGRAILEVPSPLVKVLEGLSGPSQLVARGSALPAFDYHCPLLSLPLAFNTTLDSIPHAARYLAADPMKIAFWQACLGEKAKPRVGLAWSGRAEHPNDHHRSVLLADLMSYLPDCYQYLCLQKGVRERDRIALESNASIVNVTEESSDFSDTAAVCECLDLVISVDTSIAHLSAALGKRTWVLLPLMDTDWRWLLQRDDSPWYPSVKLYRQSTAGDWSGVFARVKADLNDVL
jgi:TPR repeat/Glycosyltransferase family 9 (heptosyltransferase)